MAPADQHFGSYRQPGIGDHQRLVVQDELLVAQGDAQFGFELGTQLHFVVHARLEAGHRTASPLLGAIHGHVGMTQQGIGVVAVLRETGNADAGVDELRPAGQLERPRQGCDQRVGLAAGFVPIAAIAEGQREFVTAQAGDQPARANGVGEPLADQSQQPVTRCMSQGVVDLREAVEIDEHHGFLGGMGSGSGPGADPAAPGSRLDWAAR